MERGHWRGPQGWGRAQKGDQHQTPWRKPAYKPPGSGEVAQPELVPSSRASGNSPWEDDPWAWPWGAERFTPFPYHLSLAPCTTNRPHKRNKKENKHNTPRPGGRKGKGRTEKREKKKHAAPEGDSLCFAVACVDRNQMVSWNTRLAIWGAKHMVNGREK